MSTRTAIRRQLTLSVLSWLIAAAPIVLFSIAVFFVVEAASSGQQDWPTTAAFIQKIVVTGVLLVISIQLQFRNIAG